jgi:hypothetical protein
MKKEEAEREIRALMHMWKRSEHPNTPVSQLYSGEFITWLENNSSGHLRFNSPITGGEESRFHFPGFFFAAVFFVARFFGRSDLGLWPVILEPRRAATKRRSALIIGFLSTHSRDHSYG